MHEQDLPTWNDLIGLAFEDLHTARVSLSDARDHLHSDWRPLGTAITSQEADARSRALSLIGQAKTLIDQAKNALYDAERI
jgi:hypothetical protein